MTTVTPATAGKSAELAFQELTALWEHVPSSWTKGELRRLHDAAEKGLIELFVRERGLGELVHRFFESGLIHCESAADFADMPMPTNLASLSTLLRGDYAQALAEPDVAREELGAILSECTQLLLRAAEPQVAYALHEPAFSTRLAV